MTRSRGTRTLGGMTTSVLLDAAGRRRSPATLPGHHCGRPPRNKGLRCPADPPTVEEIVAVMRCAGLTAYGLRARALIALLWRAGVRIKRGARARQSDLDRATGGVVVRSGKGGKRGELGMDRWGWQIEPWLDYRIALPVGALLCVIDGPTAGRACSLSAARTLLCRLALIAGASHRISVAMCARSSWRHSAPVRARQPRDHVDLTPGPRQQRDHQHRLGPPGADAARQRWLR